MKHYFGFVLFILSWPIALAIPSNIKTNLHIDQFGYRCNAQKVAVISSPQTGYNVSTEAFTPGTGTNNYQVRRWSDDVVVYQGTLTSWKSGTTHTDSGDKIWWFDFSALNTSGDYYIFDVSNNVGSYQFRIADDVYKEVLKHAIRSYYYQRCGFAKVAPYAQTGFTDAASHLGPLQDTDCRLYNDKTNASTSKNLRGGWYDAGDYTKYVNFTWETLMDLLIAYEENPTAFTDDYNIPESGNGIPDILDEIKYELDWLLRMQQADGSVLSIVGHGWGSPPSTDNSQSVYGPANTSSALTCAGIFALAAIQFKSLGIPAMTTYATTLQTASVNALAWATANPNIVWRNNDAAYGSQGVGAGQAEVDDYGRQTRRIAANVFLYALTGNATYKTYVESNYNSGAQPIHLASWGYVYPFETAEQDMLLYYSKLAGVTTTVKNDIQNKFSNSTQTETGNNFPNITNQTDGYRAFLKDYTWGSCKTHAAQANIYTNMVYYGLNATNTSAYQNAAEDYVHYFHGVNPNAYVYLSNMNAYGAEKSVTSFYHGWFNDGSANWDEVGVSIYGPAPGFLVGGPNPTWSLDGCCPSGCGSPANNALCVNLTPPGSQPKMKSFKSFNTNWPQNSWAVTENGIYYQAEYIKLLSKFVNGGSCSTLPVDWLYAKATSVSTFEQSIQWATSTETNANYFMIERSTDGVHFVDIGRVSANGTTNQIISYKYSDNTSLIQPTYYRIRQVDNNDIYSYSITMVLYPSENNITVYPNPAKNKLYISANTLETSAIEIQIITVTGQIVSKQSSNSVQAELDISSLSPGMYFLLVPANGKLNTIPFVKD